MVSPVSAFLRRMRFAVLCGIVAWSGCSSVSVPNLGERRYRETRIYTQQASEVFAAVRSVLMDMGFQVESANASDGDLVATSRVLPGNPVELSRQRRAMVSVGWTTEAMSEVKIGFWDSTEQPRANEVPMTAEQIIRGGGLYDSFWKRMQEALPAELPPGANRNPTGSGSAG